MVDLSVIIVNWNVRDLLDKCLDSLRRARRSIQPGGHREFSMEIIVVDSASSDGSADILVELYQAYSWLKVVRFRRNFGQTAALAAAFAHARG